MSNIARMIAPVAVLVAGVGIAAAFVLTRPSVERRAVKPLPPRVEVVEVTSGTHATEVEALGTVMPAEEVRLQPEVTGVVRFLHPELAPGGLVEKGEVLVRIDPRNYRLAVEERRAQVAKAEADLQLERGRVRVAKKEWELLGEAGGADADEALALRKPQLRNAEVALEAAKSALERAQLDLARTVLRAPFPAVVRTEDVELGQMVGPSAPVATLAGTDAFWVQVSLPLSDLPLIERPGSDGKGGADAFVAQTTSSGELSTFEGRVIRFLGDLDPKGKMARVVVAVKDPLRRSEGTGLPLLLGSVVRVRIEGRALDDVYVLPRLGLRGDDRVWLIEEGKLAIRPVEVVFRGREEVYVRGNLGPAARVITSRLQTPVEGMAVRLEGAAPSTVELGLGAELPTPEEPAERLNGERKAAEARRAR